MMSCVDGLEYRTRLAAFRTVQCSVAVEVRGSCEMPDCLDPVWGRLVGGKQRSEPGGGFGLLFIKLKRREKSLFSRHSIAPMPCGPAESAMAEPFGRGPLRLPLSFG